MTWAPSFATYVLRGVTEAHRARVGDMHEAHCVGGQQIWWEWVAQL